MLGIIASSLAIIYFISLKFYIIISLEIGMLGLMVYGLLNHSKKANIDKYVYTFMVIIMAVLLYTLQSTSWLEFIISLLFIGALFFLARHKWNIGWICMGLGHILMCVFTYENGEYFFAALQSLSAVVAVYAIVRKGRIEAK